MNSCAVKPSHIANVDRCRPSVVRSLKYNNLCAGPANSEVEVRPVRRDGHGGRLIGGKRDCRYVRHVGVHDLNQMPIIRAEDGVGAIRCAAKEIGKRRQASKRACACHCAQLQLHDASCVEVEVAECSLADATDHVALVCFSRKVARNCKRAELNANDERNRSEHGKVPKALGCICGRTYARTGRWAGPRGGICSRHRRHVHLHNDACVRAKVRILSITHRRVQRSPVVCRQRKLADLGERAGVDLHHLHQGCAKRSKIQILRASRDARHGSA